MLLHDLELSSKFWIMSVRLLFFSVSWEGRGPVSLGCGDVEVEDSELASISFKSLWIRMKCLDVF